MENSEYFKIALHGITSNYMRPDAFYCWLLGIMLSIGFFCGRRLAIINIPDRPLLSPALRHLGVSIWKITRVATVLIIAGVGFLLLLTVGSYSSEQDTIILLTFLIIGFMIGCGIFVPTICRYIAKIELGKGLDDVEKIADRLKKLSKGYNPEKYFNIKKGFFLGLDEKGNSINVPKEAIQKNHVQIIGESGTGKSSLAGVILAQSALLGETVIVIDPKNDAFLASVLARISEKHGIPFTLLDLRPSAPPQINPLQGCEPWEVEELLIAGFELGKSGNPGTDFYRGEDRDACTEVAKIFADGAKTIPSLFQTCSKTTSITERTNYWREFRHFSSLPAFHAKAGLDLKATIDNGGILYVIGSITSDKVFTAQKMFLQRILQIISARRLEGARPVCIMLDEIKYILSIPALRALGTVRDRNCHIIIAHQSLGDLDDCAGLPPKAVRGAVHGNTSIKFAYKLNELDTALQLEGIAGKERTFVQNINTAEENHSRGWRESERPRIRADLLTHLPTRRTCAG